jgi:glycosyltransferase involved in cell wall biosynthesis
MSARLDLLVVSQYPPSPPRSGGQARVHGLMTALARRHDLTSLALAAPEELEPSARALREHCREVILLRSPAAVRGGWRRRVAQVASVASRRSFERRIFRVPGFQRVVDALLGRHRFDAVLVESPWLAQHAFRQAPPGARPPRLLLDEHNIEYDVLRQVALGEGGAARRAFNALNGWKLRGEEQALWRRYDGVTFTSEADERVARAAVPAARTAVVPNAVDLARFRPDAGTPPDGRTLLFFGALNYVPNSDAVRFLLREVWPRIAAASPTARLRIVGPNPPRDVLAHRGDRVEVTGLVDDVRAHLASAAAVLVPLRLGGGTRLKILEAMAMARPIVSSPLGAQGIDVVDGRELLLAEGAEPFAAAVRRLLDDAALGARLGSAARALVEARYSWRASARILDRLLLDVCDAPVAALAPALP